MMTAFTASSLSKKISPLNNRFGFSLDQRMDVVKAIVKLSSNAMGTHGISVKFVKSIIESTLPTITKIP